MGNILLVLHIVGVAEAASSECGVDQALAGWRWVGARDIVILLVLIWAMVAKLGT